MIHFYASQNWLPYLMNHKIRRLKPFSIWIDFVDFLYQSRPISSGSLPRQFRFKEARDFMVDTVNWLARFCFRYVSLRASVAWLTAADGCLRSRERYFGLNDQGGWGPWGQRAYSILLLVRRLLFVLGQPHQCGHRVEHNEGSHSWRDRQGNVWYQ